MKFHRRPTQVNKLLKRLTDKERKLLVDTNNSWNHLSCFTIVCSTYALLQGKKKKKFSCQGYLSSGFKESYYMVYNQISEIVPPNCLGKYTSEFLSCNKIHFGPSMVLEEESEFDHKRKKPYRMFPHDSLQPCWSSKTILSSS